MIDLERVKEKAENIINFYLDSNWEFQFIGINEAPAVQVDCRGYLYHLMCLFLFQSFPVLTGSLAKRALEVACQHSLGGKVHLIHNLREGKRWVI